MSYLTGMLVLTTPSAIRWHFWEGRKDNPWHTKHDTIRNSNQLETAIDYCSAFVCFNLHEWSLVYLMFSLACWKWLHWMWNCCQKTTFNLRDNTSTGLEQRSSDAKHRKTYGDCLNQGWISYSFRFFCILWILCRDFGISNNEPVRKGLTTRVLLLWRRCLWWSG